MNDRVSELNVFRCNSCGRAYIRKQDAERCANLCYQPKVCKRCGKQLDVNYKFTYCEDCRNKLKEEKDAETFRNATKVRFGDADESKTKAMYWSKYPYNNGYFFDIDDLEEYCESNDIDMPEYVYGTDCTRIKINAEDIIENACDDLHEDAYESISECEINELQELLDKWCEDKTGTDTYYMDEDYVIYL